MLNPNANPPLDHGTEDPPPAAFGSSEKSLDHTSPTQPTDAKNALVTVSPIDEAFTACRAVGGGGGAFDNAWMGRLHEVVEPSNRLFHLTHDKPAELARLAHLAEIRFTAATEKNPALLCIKLAARPKDTDQDKVCSEWSTLLRCALAQNISPDDFIDWVGTTTVRECKAIIARENAAARAKSGQPQRKRSRAQPDGTPVDGVAAPNGDLGDMLTLIQTAVLDALTAPGSDAERRERAAASLRSFADSLASGKMIEADDTCNDAAAEGSADA